MATSQTVRSLPATLLASGQVSDLSGSGSPEGATSAPAGSTYRDTSTGEFYRKTGSGNTGWEIVRSGYAPVVTALPTAASSLRGELRTLTATGQPDRTYICVANADGIYEWALIVGSDAVVQSTTFGNTWHGNSLSNVPIGLAGNQAWSIRWRSPKSGSVTGFKVYFVDNSAGNPEQGYSHGTGGTISITMRPDDGSGWPDMATSLATYTKTFPTMVDGTLSPRAYSDIVTHLFGLMTLSAPVAVSEGQVYHFCFENTSGTRANDWTSLNMCMAFDSPRGPAALDEMSWGLTYYVPTNPSGTRQDWSNNQDNDATFPICEIQYSDGSWHGMGYIENWISAERPISGTNRVRQVFTAEDNGTSSHLGVFLLATSGTGNVVAELKQGSTVLQTATIPATNFVGGNWTGVLLGGWVEVPFVANIVQGTEYAIEFSASGGASVLARAQQDGKFYQFNTSWAGYAQSSTDGGATWQGWHSGGQTDPVFKQGDLSVYLRLAGNGGTPETVTAQAAIATTTADIDVNSTHEVLLVDTTSNNVTVSLPTNLPDGKKITVIKVASANTMTVSGPLVNTIGNSASSDFVNLQWTSWTFVYASSVGRWLRLATGV